MMLPSTIPNCVAIDFETTGLSTFRGDRPFSAAAVFPDGRRMFWRNADNTPLRPHQHQDLARILADRSLDKVFHNAKFDWRMAEAGTSNSFPGVGGFPVRGRVWDTMIFCHLLDGRYAFDLSLETMAARYLPSDKRKVVEEITKWFDANKIGKTARYERFDILPPALLEKRNVGDADLTLCLFRRLYGTVRHAFPFLLAQEHELLPVVRKMEDRGVEVDMEEISSQQGELTLMYDDVIRFFEDMLNEDGFNINSRKHQEKALKCAGLWDQIKERTKPSKTYPNGQPKIDDSALRGLHHPVAHMLNLGKTAAKFRDTFLAQMIANAIEGVLHANFNQLGTNTGRFSCSGPNLQNIPIEGDRRAQFTNEEAEEAYEMTGYRIAPHLKRCIRVRDGYCHIHADKKQAEMAMLAHYTHDPKLIAFFESGESIHDQITMELFGEYSKGLKTQAKRIVFGYLYGAGNARLAHTLSQPIGVAVGLRRRLETVFPTLPRWKRSMDEQINERGYTETLHGRRHYLNPSESYMAVNRMCQGTVGDEIKSRMIALDKGLARKFGDGVCTVLLNIHDDIATEVPLELRQDAALEIHRIMHETSLEYRLPLASSLDITFTNYGDLKEIEDVQNVPDPIGDRPLHPHSRVGSIVD